MPHRDDLEAAHARIAALEREKAEQDGRLEKLEHERASRDQQLTRLDEDRDAELTLARRRLDSLERQLAIERVKRNVDHGIASEEFIALEDELDTEKLVAALEKTYGTGKSAEVDGDFSWQTEHAGYQLEIAATRSAGGVLLRASTPRPTPGALEFAMMLAGMAAATWGIAQFGAGLGLAVATLTFVAVFLRPLLRTAPAKKLVARAFGDARNIVVGQSKLSPGERRALLSAQNDPA